MLTGTELSAFGKSRIAPETIEAYLVTDYRVDGARPLILRIGQYSSALAALCHETGVDCAAFLTAWNPFSHHTSDQDNGAAQARLILSLDRLGLAQVPGFGADPSGNWPAEESILVLGVSLAPAATIASKFEQNGFVWAGADAIPQLVLLR